MAIVPCRIGSTRLAGKLLLPLGGMPLVVWAWTAAVEAFGAAHVVCALPADEDNDRLAVELCSRGANVFRWDGPQHDLLSRFLACADTYLLQPEDVIVRVTPDDPFKQPAALRRVAAGERLPVELGGEAFTVAALREADARLPADSPAREHLTYLFEQPPRPPPGAWTVDTRADYEAARRRIGDM